jgi:meiotic recombination protein DMC1
VESKQCSLLTAVFGEFRTEKTQLCHTLCVSTQLPLSRGAVEGNAVYIDSEGTFQPERIATIAEWFGIDPNQALDNLLYARAFTHEQQIGSFKRRLCKCLKINTN